MVTGMKLEDASRVIEAAELHLANEPFVVAHTFERDGRKISVAITARFQRKCKKGRVWKTKAMLTAFKNAEYGFDPQKPNSAGGEDGIFLLSRDFRPRNEMMKKIFDQFLDKPESGAAELAGALGVPLAELKPVRLVSHHLRLLGVLCVTGEDLLVLVDYDDTK